MKKSNPLLVLEETPPDKITIVAEFPRTDPDTLFDHWLKPELLRKWWPPAAELDPETHGNYHFFWPSRNWASQRDLHRVQQGQGI